MDDYLSRLTFQDGVYVDHKGRKNGWVSSYIALLHLNRYCQGGDVADLNAAINVRKHLAREAEVTNDSLGLLRMNYDFANPPYASKPGWGSSLAQSASTALLLLITPRFSFKNGDLVEDVVEASLHPVEVGGMFSSFGDGLIFWEEVATAERPSIIINGAQVATFYYDLVVDLLPDGSQKDRLADLNAKAIRALMDVQEQMMLPDGRILYDLTSDPINTRNPDHYAHRIAVSWLKWVGTDEAQGHLTALANDVTKP